MPNKLNTILIGITIIILLFGIGLTGCYLTKSCSITSASIWENGAFSGISPLLSNLAFGLIILLIISSIIYLIYVFTKK